MMRLARMLLIGGALMAAELPASAEDPAAVAPQAAAVDPAASMPAPTQPAPRRSTALRNTGIVMFALGAAQVVAGGLLLGLASSNSNCGGDCRTGNEVARAIGVPVVIVGGVFALVPGAIMWGVGSRL